MMIGPHNHNLCYHSYNIINIIIKYQVLAAHLRPIRWEDSNNLTSNIFTLITTPITHKNTSCSCKQNTKKMKEKMEKKIKQKIVRYVHCLKETGAKKPYTYKD